MTLAEHPKNKGAMVHVTSYIDEEVKIGKGTKIWHFSHILTDTEIGEGCSFGQNCVIGPHVRIGKYCKIQNNVSIYNGVELADYVFCGPSCVFTNVRNPRSAYPKNNVFDQTKVGYGVTIGANATIVCGISLGDYAFVGAGSVVTKDVDKFALVVGNPARQIGWVSRFGEKLGTDLTCLRSGEQYVEKDGHLELLK